MYIYMYTYIPMCVVIHIYKSLDENQIFTTVISMLQTSKTGALHSFLEFILLDKLIQRRVFLNLILYLKK